MNTASRNLLALVPLGVWTAAAPAAPLTFNTALPISQDEWILREQFVYMKSTDDPTPMNRRMEVSGLMSMLGYGVTRNFAVFAVLPYTDKRLTMNMGGQDIDRSQAGVGDAMFMGRYTAYEDNATGHTFRIAPFLVVSRRRPAATTHPTALDGCRPCFSPALVRGTGKAVRLLPTNRWIGAAMSSLPINRTAKPTASGRVRFPAWMCRFSAGYGPARWAKAFPASSMVGWRPT